MVMGIKIRVEGLDRLERELNAMPRQIDTALGRATLRVAWVGEARMAEYPDETEANRPGPYPKRWYDRGFGPRWRNLISGNIRGPNTSERLQQSWMAQRIGVLEAEIFTRSTVTGREVSYVDVVQGEETQDSLHAARGWQTDAEVSEELERDPIIDRILDEEFRRALGGAVT